ncbi:MAG: hypothetical protein QGG39_00450 [Candidatus Poribacteria bacterium]|jgi:hypothetical protein|nr:hypothetical protein [Candidatus Poribacteria bacterium]
MVKLLAFLSIIFYFFAVFFGMMFYFDNYGERDATTLLSAGELYGYSTVDVKTPEIAREIQNLLEQERDLQISIDGLQSSLKAAIADREEATQKYDEIKKKLDDASKKVANYEKGLDLANLLLKMKADQAAASIGVYSDLELQFFVRYAVPQMAQDKAQEKLYKKLMEAVGQDMILATKIGKFTIQKEERAPD